MGRLTPRYLAPARVQESNWVRNLIRAEHVPQNGKDLRLCLFVGLGLNDVGLRGHNRNENDARSFEESWSVKRLPDGIVSSLQRVCVQEKLRVAVPEDFVRRELEEDFGVGCHLEGLDAFLLPSWELRREFDSVVLQDAEAFDGRNH